MGEASNCIPCSLTVLSAYSMFILPKFARDVSKNIILHVLKKLFDGVVKTNLVQLVLHC